MSPILVSKRDLRTSRDLSPEDIHAILDRSAALKAALRAASRRPCSPAAPWP